MYKVTNKAKDTRKFRDGYAGRDIFVEPGKSVLTQRPPEKNDVWKVDKHEESEEKIIKKIDKERVKV